MSGRPSAAAPTRTVTCAGPGRGAGTSSTRRASAGSPWWWTRSARISGARLGAERAPPGEVRDGLVVVSEDRAHHRRGVLTQRRWRRGPDLSTSVEPERRREHRLAPESRYVEIHDGLAGGQPGGTHRVVDRLVPRRGDPVSFQFVDPLGPRTSGEPPAPDPLESRPI